MFCLSLQKQMQDYVVWVNSYLRNKPSCPQITDLKAGMQDGVTLVSLVEVAGKRRYLIYGGV